MDSSAELQHLPPVTPRLVEPPARGDHADTVAALVHAERLSGEHRYAEAIAVLGDVQIPSSSAPELALHVLFSEAWSRMYLGQLGSAVATLERARALAEGPSFTDLDRAEALFRLGCCRVKLSKISNAVALFTAALGLVDEGTVNGDRLRSRIFDWRSRCYQLQREWEAAQVDAERSLELAHSVGADRLVVLAKMQCSIVAERRGDRLLARYLGGPKWGPAGNGKRLARRHYYAYRRLHPDWLAWTVNTKADFAYHYAAARGLSVREAARIQGFPDRFHFTTAPAGTPGQYRNGARHSRYRQVGNAVPPLLGAALGRAVARMLGAAQDDEGLAAAA